jgi:hypothetical protein
LAGIAFSLSSKSAAPKEERRVVRRAGEAMQSVCVRYEPVITIAFQNFYPPQRLHVITAPERCLQQRRAAVVAEAVAAGAADDHAITQRGIGCGIQTACCV